jgi:D-alanyl-D-alanine carboxypeptidase
VRFAVGEVCGMTFTKEHPVKNLMHDHGPAGRWSGPSLVALVLAVSIALTATACGKEKSHPVSAKLSGQLQHILDTGVASSETDFPGTAFSVSQPGLGTWAGAAGEAETATHTSMKAGDTFRAGSIMKPFVAVVVLQLVEEGKLGLDDRLTAVLPERVVDRVANGPRITVRMLLNHTSGIANYADESFDRSVLADPHRRWTVGDFLDLAAAKQPTSAPGAKYSYANTNYNLLGLVIEQATGEPWRQAVRDRVIDQLGLEHTSLPEPGGTASGGVSAHGYNVVDGKLRDVTEIDTSMADAAGGDALVTTTADLSRFLTALLAGDLFKERKTLREMKTWVKASDGAGLTGYGLGLERYEFPGGVELIGHVGSTAGYFAVMFRLPAQRLDVSMVMTSQVYSPAVLMPALMLLVAEAS